MTLEAIEVSRPDRWDHPLSDEMNSEQVAWLLSRAPFSGMDEARFSQAAKLEDILRNDTRIVRLEPGEVVFQEGQYGGSAYLVLDGRVQIFLTKLMHTDNASRRTRPDWLAWLKRRRSGAKKDRRKTNRRESGNIAEDRSNAATPPELEYRGEGSETRVYLQDIPGVLSQHQTSQIEAGELFGEMAAVSRTPREFSAVADVPCTVLEIRWQGLKLLKQDPAFRELLDERYRAEVLRTHLRETMLFRFIPEEALQKVIEQTKFESFGDLEWYAEYKINAQQSAQVRIESEPLVAEEGAYATGLWIIRAGFARLSRRQGAGHRTLAYLGKGHLFGLRELVHNSGRYGHDTPLPYQESLRAIGYVDALCIPKQVVNEHILPYVRARDLPAPIETPRYQFGQPVVDAPLDIAEHNVETGLLEFLVDQRLMNGRQTMVIDTERCTRCDDCVRACAKTHQGEPVFVRQGPQYGPWMFAHACMHCEDPVCMIGCPTGAIHRDHESGMVQINAATCIGCQTCAQSCPYDNIRMVQSSDGQGRARVDEKTGLPILQASKCDLCASAGGKPACQTACPHDALVRIDMSDMGPLSKHIQSRRSS